MKKHILPFFFPSLLMLTGILAYSNSFNGVFIFDDISFIVNNQYIHTLFPPWEAMFKGIHQIRPISGLSFAINYAISGPEIWSYHLFNLLIHLIAGLALYGILLETFQQTQLKDKAGILSFLISATWLIHPLTTESVTFITQRYESLMGMFFLLSVWSYVKYLKSTAYRKAWCTACILFCLLAAASKQVAAVIPVLIYLFDVTFFTRSFKHSLIRNWHILLAMATSWLLIAILLVRAMPFEWAGYNMRFITPLKYALSEFGVITHYIRLALWPDALVFDYNWQLAETPGEILPYMIFILTLVICSLWGLYKKHPFGFLGITFFLILAPTSSIMPLPDLAADHRMYLPLIPLITITILLLDQFFQYLDSLKILPQNALSIPVKHGQVLFRFVSLTIICAFGVLTFERNMLYASKVDMWKDTIEKAPHNPRAWANLGNALAEEKRYDEALPALHKALDLRPGFATVLINLGVIAKLRNETDKAIEYWTLALISEPEKLTYYNLAMLYLFKREKKEAKIYLKTVLLTNPKWPPALIQLARLYAVDDKSSLEKKKRSLKMAELAISEKQQDDPLYLDTLASAYAANGMFKQAIKAQQTAVSLSLPLKNNDLIKTFLYRLQLYKSRQPYFEPEDKIDITLGFPR